jgi:hypothetical protein
MALKDEGINFFIWEQILTGKSTFVKMGKDKGIKFFIYPKEEGHYEPHFHAKYQDAEISISLISFQVLAGNLPPRQQKQAIDWCKDNIETLKKYWGKYHEEIVA